MQKIRIESTVPGAYGTLSLCDPEMQSDGGALVQVEGAVYLPKDKYGDVRPDLRAGEVECAGMKLHPWWGVDANLAEGRYTHRCRRRTFTASSVAEAAQEAEKWVRDALAVVERIYHHRQQVRWKAEEVWRIMVALREGKLYRREGSRYVRVK